MGGVGAGAATECALAGYLDAGAGAADDVGPVAPDHGAPAISTSPVPARPGPLPLGQPACLGHPVAGGPCHLAQRGRPAAERFLRSARMAAAVPSPAALSASAPSFRCHDRGAICAARLWPALVLLGYAVDGDVVADCRLDCSDHPAGGGAGVALCRAHPPVAVGLGAGPFGHGQVGSRRRCLGSGCFRGAGPAGRPDPVAAIAGIGDRSGLCV